MKKLKLMFTIITLSLFFTDCSKGDSNDTIIDTNLDKPSISSNKSSLTFEDTMLTRSSIANSISISKDVLKFSRFNYSNLCIILSWQIIHQYIQIYI